MVRPPREFRDLAEKFVCVRVTDMRGIDLNRYRFDFDLTLAILLMHPDGTIYHRFGGRDHTSPTRWVAMKPLLVVMREALRADAAYRAAAIKVRTLPSPRTIEDFPTWREFIGDRKIDCAHCHQVGEHEVESAMRAGGFDRESIWRWPPPERIGLEMDPLDQQRVASVRAKSPAARAGLAPGDRLDSIAGVRIASVTDIQAALDELPGHGEELRTIVAYRRGDRLQHAVLALPDGWKRGTPLTFSWRPLKWPLSPAPGFGGQDLTAEEKKALGIDATKYAFRIGYLVDWGRKAHRGRNARKAGLRRGDVVVSVAGKDDFRDQNHFHAWFRLTRRVGERVDVVILRAGKRRAITLDVVK